MDESGWKVVADESSDARRIAETKLGESRNKASSEPHEGFSQDLLEPQRPSASQTVAAGYQDKQLLSAPVRLRYRGVDA